MKERKENAFLILILLLMLLAVAAVVATIVRSSGTQKADPTTQATMESEGDPMQTTGPAAEGTTSAAVSGKKSYDLEKDVLYFGRTYTQSRIRWFNWSGSGFSVRFQGSGVAAEFYSDAPEVKHYTYLKVYVDGKEQKDIILREETQIVILAEGLDPEKEHTVEVRKRTNIRSSTAGVGRIELLDGAVLAPLQPKDRLIEFVGDSLTVGYVASKDGKTATAWSTTTEDVTKTYCTQIAAAFGAEYQTVAVSGRGIVRNNGGDAEGLFPQIYRELDMYHQPGAAYDFAVQPDVIVINLGTNDESAANAQLPEAEFKDGLYRFLKEVRQYNPDAQIVYAYGMVRVKLSGAIESVVDQLRAEGDGKIHYLQLEQCQSWELNLNHTVAAAYVSRGEAIIEKIREITGWKAGA